MKSFIPWIGGKSLLADQIIKHFPADISRYIEVFGGGASILFAKEKHAPMEVYNDKNGELVNLFRCIKYHPEELRKEISGLLNSRQLFMESQELISIPHLTDIQRAARFFNIIRCSFGADANSFGCKERNLTTSTDCFKAIQNRLISAKSVVIEQKDFENLIQVYDRRTALFYCDPPYYGTEKTYQINFPKEDHKRLFDILSNIQGRFVLSYNNSPFVKDLYKNFKITEISRQNNLSKGQYNELIIQNF